MQGKIISIKVLSEKKSYLGRKEKVYIRIAGDNGFSKFIEGEVSENLYQIEVSPGKYEVAVSETEFSHAKKVSKVLMGGAFKMAGSTFLDLARGDVISTMGKWGTGMLDTTRKGMDVSKEKNVCCVDMNEKDYVSICCTISKKGDIRVSCND